MKQISVDAVCQSVRVSQTTLNVLRECERCFWLHLHGVRRPGGSEGSWPTIARGLDTVISHYCAPYRDQNALPPLLLQHLRGRLVTVRTGPCFDPDTGLTLVDRLHECLELDGGLFAPIDHKTQGLAPHGVQEAERLQLDLYTLLLAESGYSVADYGILVYYVPVDGELHEGFPFKVHVHKADTDAERARTWLRRARAVLDLADPPEPSPDCPYCDRALLAGTIADKIEALA
ncbi:MAG: PD-(D/E)XK nuclease family protein [Anaerolineae bacterium]